LVESWAAEQDMIAGGSSAELDTVVAASSNAELLSDMRVRHFAETYRKWIRRFLLFVTPISVIGSVLSAPEEAPNPIALATTALVAGMMFAPFSARLSMSLSTIFAMPLLIASQFSMPGIATFVGLGPAYYPMYAVCFGGIVFGAAYWVVLIGFYIIAMLLHYWNILTPVAVPMFGIPLSSWIFIVLFNGFMCALVLGWICFVSYKFVPTEYPIRGTSCLSR
jgi:hypothetical protein